MPVAVGVVASVIGGVASAVGTVAVAISSIVGSVLGPVMATIGSVVTAIATTVGPLLASAITSIGSVMQGIVSAIGGAIEGTVTALKATIGPVVKSLNAAISGILGAITKPLAPILNPIASALSAVNAEIKAIDVAVTTALGPVAEAVKLIGTVASLKIVYDLLTGQGGILKAITVISDNTELGTMQAIAELTKTITGTTVGIIDKVDNEFGLLAASIDTFPERISASAKQLKEDIDAEILATITPRIDTLGRASNAMNHSIAALYRHFEDEPWFIKMLTKVWP